VLPATCDVQLSGWFAKLLFLINSYFSCFARCFLTCSPPAMSLVVPAAILITNFFAAIAVITLNKRAFSHFPFPAALTAVHYFMSWAGIVTLRRAGAFGPRPVPSGHMRVYYALIVCWSVGNALSNISLDRNSVGFYQLAKILVTPSIVAFDFLAYGRRTTVAQAIALLLACIGIGIASVSDVQLKALGAAVACAAVATSAAQKVLNSHVQQIGGMSTLQVMDKAFPPMCLLSLMYVPVFDSNLDQLASLRWFSVESVLAILASAAAAFCATWSATRIFGLISALAHVLLGQVKTCIVLLIGAFFYDARTTTQGIIGASLALGSITAYSMLRLPSCTEGDGSGEGMGQVYKRAASEGSEASAVEDGVERLLARA